jgi:hypothetical protein
MRFGTWGVRSLCATGSLQTVPRAFEKYERVAAQRSEGRRVALITQRIVHASVERRIKNVRAR